MKNHHFIKRVFIIILLLIIVAVNTTKIYCAPATGELASGMSIDCARRYYSVNIIKGFIDALSGYDGAFLQLHLTDDQNVGVECDFLNQTKNNAEYLSDGSYRNIQTGKRFLSSDQIAEIIDYATQKNVKIIPEIDAPSHMEGFFILKEIKDGKTAADALAYDRVGYPGELNISSLTAIDFVKDIYDEYANMFKNCSYFHIGCDELFSGTAASKTSYITTMSSYMMNKGFIVRMWNDLLTKNNINSINKNIQVTYWSYDGDAQDPATINERRAERASALELQEAGFDLLIYNSYYLYYVPSVGNYNTHDNDYAVNDVLNNWTVKNWDSNSGASLTSTANIIGSATSLWSEDSSGLTESQISEHFIRLYKAMAEVNQKTTKDIPYTPHVVSATASDTSITVLWNAASNAEGYRVYRKTANENWIVIADNLSASTTSYTDLTTQPNTTYFYTVQSYLIDPVQGVVWSGMEEPGVNALISSLPKPGTNSTAVVVCTFPNATFYARNNHSTFTKTVDKQDVEVGQVVTFTINDVVPDTTGYNYYLYKIKDYMSSGLTITPSTADLTVQFGSDLIDYSAYQTMNGKTDITISDSDIVLTFDMSKHQAYVGKPITITYKATVTKQAIATLTQNEASLIYSNDPSDTSSTDTIGPIRVPIYTSKIQLTKTDADKQDMKLKNAGFILIKKSVNPFQYYVFDKQTGIGSWSENENDASVILTDANGLAEFNVSDGTYVLKEVQAPVGYNLSTQTEYLVEVTHSTDSEGLPIGIIENIVINNSQVALSAKTGSNDTTILYIFGGLLLLIVTTIILAILFKRKH